MVDQKKWLELSLTVSGELAEAVSDVLNRYLDNGLVLEKAITYEGLYQTVKEADVVRVVGYLSVDKSLDEKKSLIEKALWHLGTIQPLPDIKYQIIQDQNWMEKWKEHYNPIVIGKRLLVLPPWIDNPYPSRIPVRIDPNMAFGTGTHPSTQLCLKLIENNMKPGMEVIDIGCGSGILSIGALLLGARHALAVDIDALAVQATKDNASLNGVSDRIECGMGSIMEIKQNEFSIDRSDIVIANILAPVIISMLHEGLAQLVRTNGILILSGILDQQVGEVSKSAASFGLTYSVREQMDDWVAITLIKPA